MAFDKAKVLRAAEKSLAQGKIPAAIAEYCRIVEADPEDFSALNTLGDLYTREDKKQEAIACYQRVAAHYREQGFSFKAIAMYKKLARFAPNDYKLAMTLASLYEQQGLTIDARTHYLIAAEAQRREGHTREALEVLTRIAELDPNNIEIRLHLAKSCEAEKLPDLAADAYTAAGEQLTARGDHEQALEAYTHALALRPRSHAALHGLVAVHSALGTADEAAEMLEQAIVANPGDFELRAMLARAYVEAENSWQAERVTEELVGVEPASFTLFFDVARLYLAQANLERCTHIIRRVLELAPTGKPEETLVELLQEVLARDPEQLDALHLLVRIHQWRRDDERLRATLERLVDVTETTGDRDEERKALAHLLRLAPGEARYSSRLETLGGPLPGDGAPVAEASYAGISGESEVPTFESFMLNDDSFAARAQTDDVPTIADFDWSIPDASAETVVAGDASAAAVPSFADLDDLTMTAPSAAASEANNQTNYQEVDFGAPAASQPPDRARLEKALVQDLEGVDFYIAQGYTDIARDTLDALEGQYGAHVEIEARRHLLSSEVADPVASSMTLDEAPRVKVESGGFVDVSAFDLGEIAATTDNVSPSTSQTETAAAASGNGQPAAAGLDSGLAAIFDEFRDAVEESSDSTEVDYETHFNTGLAYREMGLLDQAIEVLQTAIEATAPNDGTPRYLQCCNLLGHCFMEKDMPRPAAMWFRKGLGAPGHTEDEYQALRYELGAAYERMGDLEKAIEIFTEVYSTDVSYRGVAGKLRSLEKRKSEVRG